MPNVFVNKICGRFCSKGMILLNITPNYPCTQHTHNHISNEHNLSNQYISINSVKIVYIVYNSESTKFKSYNGYNCKIATYTLYVLKFQDFSSSFFPLPGLLLPVENSHIFSLTTCCKCLQNCSNIQLHVFTIQLGTL